MDDNTRDSVKFTVVALGCGVLFGIVVIPVASVLGSWVFIRLAELIGLI